MVVAIIGDELGFADAVPLGRPPSPATHAEQRPSSFGSAIEPAVQDATRRHIPHVTPIPLPDRFGQHVRVDARRALLDLLAEHREAGFPPEVDKGRAYGVVDPVLIDANIFGWALTRHRAV